MDDLIGQIEPMIPALRRYARALVIDREIADDLVQDCLERVVANWHLRRKTEARTWVFAILHNLALNSIRQAARDGAKTNIEDVPEQASAVGATQTDMLYGKEVLVAIDRLSPDHRSVLLLISVEDLSYAEAAEVLGIATGTVMSRLSRAREQLRRLLDEPEERKMPGALHLRSVK